MRLEQIRYEQITYMQIEQSIADYLEIDIFHT